MELCVWLLQRALHVNPKQRPWKEFCVSQPRRPFNSRRIVIYIAWMFPTERGWVCALLLLYAFKYLLAYRGYSYSTVTHGGKNQPTINCSAVSKKMPQKKSVPGKFDWPKEKQIKERKRPIFSLRCCWKGWEYHFHSGIMFSGKTQKQMFLIRNTHCLHITTMNR